MGGFLHLHIRRTSYYTGDRSGFYCMCRIGAIFVWAGSEGLDWFEQANRQGKAKAHCGESKQERITKDIIEQILSFRRAREKWEGNISTMPGRGRGDKREDNYA